MSQSKLNLVEFQRDGSGISPTTNCSKLWEIQGDCLPTRHYCMFEENNSVVKLMVKWYAECLSVPFVHKDHL